MRSYKNVESQVDGQIVDLINQSRYEGLLNSQDAAFRAAMEEMEKVHDFVGTPERILGSPSTKHGEIAERLEEGITNARSLLNGGDIRIKSAHIPRFDTRVDYTLDGVDVQSKYINGLSRTLGADSGVLKTLSNHPNFGRNGEIFHISKDQFEEIQQVRQGVPPSEYNQKTINTVLKRVSEIEAQTGRDFDDVVRPGNSTYSEVQQGRIHNTLEKHERDLTNEHQQLRENISPKDNANLAEGIQAAGIGAAVGSGFAFLNGLYEHHRNGKNPFKGELTREDWKALGVDSAKGAVVGGISGGAIYALTNAAGLSAPFAAATVAAARGVNALARSYQNGEISRKEFIHQSFLACGESAAIGVATVAGQTLIPIPVVGALIGSIAGKVLISILKNSHELVRHIEAEMESFRTSLEAKYQRILEKITTVYDQLGELTETAFDPKNNKRMLEMSASLARAYHVPEHKLLKSIDEIDDYFLS